MIYISNELYHYGVKGQKWGVRKQRPNVNTQLRQLKREEAKEHAEYKKKTSNWSPAQKRVYSMTGKLVDPKTIKQKSNGSTVVDMGTYELVFNKDGSTMSRPKRKK